MVLLSLNKAQSINSAPSGLIVTEVKRLLVITHSSDAIYVWRQRFGECELADGIDAAVMGDQRLNGCAKIVFSMIYSAETILLHRQLPFSFSAISSPLHWAIFC